ncbi:MAG: hypothetical protein LQ349_004570 [Xanthoria aureola]|nr:MAG: hypothetical protein LQ349_004570 [Xanthoria aureola]
MEPTVLVTGGSGFVGSAVVTALKGRHPEWKLSVLDLQEPIEPQLQVEYWYCDITNQTEVETLIAKIKPTGIIHTAGIVPHLRDRYSREARQSIFKVNVDGTRNVVTAARNNNVKALVWTGSCTAVTDDFSQQYPNIDESWPTSSHSLIYGESKTAAEAIVLAASNQHLATCALRPSVIFGPGDRQLIPALHACIVNGETPFVVGTGLNMWDITYVDNVAHAHVLAMENLFSTQTAAGQAILISNEQPLPFRDFCLAVWKSFGHYPPFQVNIPRRLAASIGLVAEWVTWLTGYPATLSRGSVQDACQIRYCSGVKAREILGYKPSVSIEEGIRTSCNVDSKV